MNPASSESQEIDLLQACLEQPQSALAPGAEALRPLLRAAQYLGELPLPALDPSFERRIEMQVRLRARELAATRRGAANGRVQTRLAGLPRFAAAAAVLLFVLVAALGGAVVVSAESLPGSPLYPIKRAAEHLRLTFVSSAAGRSALHAGFAFRRLDEAIRLRDARREWDPSLLVEMERELSDAAAAADRAPGAGADEAWERIEEVTRAASASLTQLGAGDELTRQAAAAFDRAQSRALARLGRVAREKPERTPEAASPEAPVIVPTEGTSGPPDSTAAPGKRGDELPNRETQTHGERQTPRPAKATAPTAGPPGRSSGTVGPLSSPNPGVTANQTPSPRSDKSTGPEAGQPQAGGHAGDDRGGDGGNSGGGSTDRGASSSHGESKGQGKKGN